MNNSVQRANYAAHQVRGHNNNQSSYRDKDGKLPGMDSGWNLIRSQLSSYKNNGALANGNNG